MLRRYLALFFGKTAVRDAERLIRSHGSGALSMARHAVQASRETRRGDHWTRVLRRIEHRSNYRPW